MSSFWSSRLVDCVRNGQRTAMTMVAAFVVSMSGSSTQATSWTTSPNKTRMDHENEMWNTMAEDNDQDNSNSDDGEIWQGQVLKRQLYTPKYPYPLWDYDWDGRMTPETTLEAQRESEEEPIVGTTRHLILIRHGQYHEHPKSDQEKTLTPLGRMQAELTGRRLAELTRKTLGGGDACPIKTLYCSDMTRAKETAAIIAKHLGDHVQMAMPDPNLNEALPAPIIPVRPDIDAEAEIDANRKRIEDAFQHYIHRASGEKASTANSKQENQQEERHEFEILVCHGNIIRYFFCRALQIPPEAWLRLSVFNCSLTYLVIKPNGYVSCRMLGDIGHLGYPHSTFSMHHGFVWS